MSASRLFSASNDSHELEPCSDGAEALHGGKFSILILRFNVWRKKPGLFLALRQKLIVCRDVNPRKTEWPSESGPFCGYRVFIPLAIGPESDNNV